MSTSGVEHSSLRTEPVTTPPDQDAAGGPSIGTRGVRGALSLILRQGVTQLLSVAAGIALFNLLTPADLGVYAIVLLSYSVLLAFGDAGLGASLVQQRHEPTEHEISLIFTGQQVIVVSLAVIGALATPFVVRAFSLGAEIRPLLWCACGAFLVASVGTISTARLERNLRFGRLGAIGIVQSVAFSGVSVLLAATGHGAASMGLALLVQSVLGAVLAYASAPYRFRVEWDPSELRRRLAFGLPVQGSQVVSLAKDSITPVLALLLLGKAQVGQINFAGQLTAYAAIGLMALGKLYLPLFSRLAHDRDRLREATEYTVLFANALVAPIAVLTLVYAQPVMHLIFSVSEPDKWDPALPLFYIMWASNLFVPTSTPLLGLMSALGRPKIALMMGLIWMSATWIIGAPLIAVMGAAGFAVANLAVQLTNLVLFRIASRELGLRLWPPIVKPWSLGLVLGVLALCVRMLLPPRNQLELVGELLLGCVIYLLLLLAVLKDERRTFIRLVALRTKPVVPGPWKDLR